MSTFGFEAKAYYGAAGSSASTELTIIRDCTTDLSATEGETTTRGTGGVKTYAAGLKDWSISFDIDNAPTNAGFVALQTAYSARSLIALKVLDSESGWGVDADFVITTFNRGEPLDEIQTVSVTARPGYATRAPSFVTGATE